MISECGSLASIWDRISGFLGLQKHDIDCISRNFRADSSRCWDKALDQWIHQNYSTTSFGLPSWRTLLRAVAKVDRRLFKELASNHKVCNTCNNVYNECMILCVTVTNVNACMNVPLHIMTLVLVQ